MHRVDIQSIRVPCTLVPIYRKQNNRMPIKSQLLLSKRVWSRASGKWSHRASCQYVFSTLESLASDDLCIFMLVSMFATTSQRFPRRRIPFAMTLSFSKYWFSCYRQAAMSCPVAEMSTEKNCAENWINKLTKSIGKGSSVGLCQENVLHRTHSKRQFRNSTIYFARNFDQINESLESRCVGMIIAKPKYMFSLRPALSLSPSLLLSLFKFSRSTSL